MSDGMVTWAYRAYRSKGMKHLLKEGAIYLVRATLVLPFLKAFDHRTFFFQGRRYRYFYRAYNFTWRDERAVEVPIVWGFVQQYPPEKFLEVGNVFSHYFKLRHDIVDKYEICKGVSNIDIVDFQSSKKYDLIVCVSTLEHVGFDEPVKEPDKIERVVAKIRSLLSEKGTAIFTVPLGHNPTLDKAIEERSLFDEQFYMKRLSQRNAWEQRQWDEVKGTKYGSPFNAANSIVVGFVSKGRAQLLRNPEGNQTTNRLLTVGENP
jgi:hypothetical protein